MLSFCLRRSSYTPSGTVKPGRDSHEPILAWDGLVHVNCVNKLEQCHPGLPIKAAKAGICQSAVLRYLFSNTAHPIHLAESVPLTCLSLLVVINNVSIRNMDI
jgi:hypothetical protein